MAEKDKPSKFKSKQLATTKLVPQAYTVVDDILLRRAQAEKLAAFEQMIAQQAQGTNYAVNPNRYIAPNTEVYPFNESLNASGFVIDDQPNRVYINAAPRQQEQANAYQSVTARDPNMQEAYQRQQERYKLGTLAHEAAHVGQNANKITPAEYEANKALYDNLAYKYYDATKLSGELPDGYTNPFRGSGTAPSELGAYMSQYEAIHPSAKTAQGVQALMPIEKSYLGTKILPREKGLRAIYDSLFSGKFNADPKAMDVIHKMMGQTRKK